ncbi:FG-GAP repeat family protein [Lysobacter antibioticus]|nr:FG-GAP repeat family protein [Lysobacter antibioticus]
MFVATSVLLLAVACGRTSDPQAEVVAVDLTEGAAAASVSGGHTVSSLRGVAIQSRPALVSASAASVRFASLADRGELAAYPMVTAPEREGALVWYRAQVSEDHALRAIATGRLEFRAPSGQLLGFRYERHVEHPSGDWTWIGRLEGAAGQEAILTFGEKAAFGNLGLPEGGSLELTVRDGVSWIIEVDPSQLHKSPGLLSPPVNDSLMPYQTAQISTGSSGTAALAATSAATAITAPVIDVALGYTPGLTAIYGSQSGAVTRLSFLIDVTNEAYANSSIGMRLRLVHTMLVNYSDSVSNNIALHEVTGWDGANPIAVPASLAPLWVAREQFGADLVGLVRPFRSSSKGCGAAWILGGNQKLVTARDERFGYSVVSDGSDAGSFCRAESLAHELGHNMGQAHNQEDAGQSGAHAYSYSYRESSSAGFNTVMAYANGSQTPIRHFANPNISYGGRPTGIANVSDNARSMNQAMPLIAGFRATAVSFKTSVHNDVNGDGRSDILWNNLEMQRFDWWKMNGSSRDDVGSQFIAKQYWVSATGDFNGDGRSDLFWRDSNTLWVWQAETNGSFSIHFVADYPRSGNWQIKGARDLNNDGFADIIWMNPDTGEVNWWLMRGAQRLAVGRKFVPRGGYSIEAIGDFNGDGRGDLLWRDNTTLWFWLADPGAADFTIAFVSPYPNQNWYVFGAADVNGDGRDDILWQNTYLQQIDWWYMNGATRLGVGSKGVSNEYKVATVGDFDGDGRSDIFWRDNAKTSLWMWQANTIGGFDILSIGQYPAGGWEIVKPVWMR